MQEARNEAGFLITLTEQDHSHSIVAGGLLDTS